MTDDKHDERIEIARFRYKVISPLIDASQGSVSALAETLSKQSYKIPGSTRTYIAPTTMYDWLQQFRTGGFDALMPKTRSDSRRPRRLEPEVIEVLLATKQEHSDWSVRMVIKQVYQQGLVDRSIRLPRSTVHRLFQREGLMDRKDPTVHDRRRFAFQWAGEMWQSDVLHGPKVKDEHGRSRKTYLLALIDDATRLSPYCEFSFSENTQSFLPVFRQALERRGIPKRLFVDNGALYRSKTLDIICAKLGVALIHTRPYSPTSKGKGSYCTRSRRSACYL